MWVVILNKVVRADFPEMVLFKQIYRMLGREHALCGRSSLGRKAERSSGMSECEEAG